jgi:hypothetical protein
MSQQASTTAEIEAESTSPVDAASRTAAIELIGIAKRFHSRRGSVIASSSRCSALPAAARPPRCG